MRGLLKPFILLGVGGFLYVMFELAFRGYSHWTMFFVGGLCFLLVGGINEYFDWDMAFLFQCCVGGLIITGVEYVAGMILNVWLKLNIWDYSDLPMNIKGQICLPFIILWVVLAAVAIVLDDYLRHWLFGEERPRYKV